MPPRADGRLSNAGVTARQKFRRWSTFADRRRVLHLVCIAIEIGIIPARFCTSLPQGPVTTTFANKLMEPVLGARLRVLASAFELSSSTECLLGIRHSGAAMSERVEETFVEVIRSADLQTGVADLAEAGIDQLLQDGFLRDVPLLGTLLGVLRTAGGIRDLLLAKKLGRFLFALRRVSPHDREVFCDSLVTSAERRRVGEALLLLLDRLDDMEKPELLARVFRAVVRGHLDRETFRLMASAIDRLHLPHLAVLIAFYSDQSTHPSTAPSDRDVYQALALAGLLRVEARGNGAGLFDPSMAGATLTYGRNELGTRFVEIVTRDA
jgi:hypothetical protein